MAVSDEFGSSVVPRVTAVRRVPYQGWVHSMEVAEDHSFVANGVVVHNCEQGVNQDAKYTILSKMAHCSDGSCPIYLGDTVSSTTIKNAVRLAEVPSAPRQEGIRAPGSSPSQAGQWRNADMRGGNERADVEQVARADTDYDDEDPGENFQEVADFLEEHGRAYIIGEERRAALEKTPDGKLLLRLLSRTSDTSSTHSLDDLYDTIGKAVGHVNGAEQFHKGWVRDQKVHSEMKDVSDDELVDHLRGDIDTFEDEIGEDEELIGELENASNPLSRPGGGSVQEHGMPDRQGGMVSDPDFTELSDEGDQRQAPQRGLAERGAEDLLFPQCKHGCRTGEFLTVDDLDKSDVPWEPTGDYDEPPEELVNSTLPGGAEHGHTREDEEYYLYKSLTTLDKENNPDTNYTTIAVVQDPRRPGKVLMGRRTDNKYGDIHVLPGGHIRQGETVRQGCERELFEETGVRAQANRIIGSEKGDHVLFIDMTLTGGEPRDTTEMHQNEFVDVNDVETMPSNRRAVDLVLGGALSKHESEVGHLHAPDFEAKGPQTFGADLDSTERNDDGEFKMLTPVEEPVKHTDDLNVMKCSLCRAEETLDKLLSNRRVSLEAGAGLRLMGRFALGSLRKGFQNVGLVAGEWSALPVEGAPEGILNNGLGVKLNTLISQYGAVALNIGRVDLWKEAYFARQALDKFHPVEGKAAYNTLEDVLARLIAVRTAIEDKDTAVRDKYNETVNSVLGLLTDYQVREELGGFNPLQDPFSGHSGETSEEHSDHVQKGIRLGWYGNAQRVVARAAHSLRSRLGDEGDLPEEARVALQSVLEDMDDLENALGVTEEMEKGLIGAPEPELEIVREIARSTEGNVEAADELLESVGARS